MILITKIEQPDFNQKLFQNILNRNLSNKSITNIVVFTDATYISNNKRITVFNELPIESMCVEKTIKVFPGKVLCWSKWYVLYNNQLSKFDKIENIETFYQSDFLIFNPKNFIKKHPHVSDCLIGKKVDISNQLITEKVVIKNEVKIETTQDSIKVKGIKYCPSPEMINIKKIDVIIISVDYNDTLGFCIENNKKYFKNITVVTSSKDEKCKEICDNFEVRCIVTDKMYDEGNPFNKGKAINEGISSIENPDWILILDADTLLTELIEIKDLEKNTLYTSDRYICKRYNHYQKWQKSEISLAEIGYYEKDKALGFFQLFNYNSEKINKLKTYPENFKNAAGSDIEFSKQFDKKERLTTCIHLGKISKNWEGRISEEFIKKEEIDLFIEKNKFDINKYFDKIYCINLDRREDRWSKVNGQFKNLSIEVERFSAIDGQYIDFLPEKKLNEKTLSKEGFLENSNALGCLMSHLEILKIAKNKNLSRILIFEDDVIFTDDFMQEIKLLKEFDWKIFYLGASQFIWSDIKIENKFYKCRNTLGTFAYAVDCSIYDEIIELLEGKKLSVDNYLKKIQEKYDNQCFVIYPNIVVSDVEDSNIRKPISLTKYSEKVRWENIESIKKDKLKVLLVPDVKGWAFDNIANSIVKYNSKPDKIFYDVIYITDLHKGEKINYEDWDYVYVFFEAEKAIPYSEKIIRGCYSAFWLENNEYSPVKFAELFSKCSASIYANDYLRDEVVKNMNTPHTTTVIHDSSDETKFYPISGVKEDKFTVIFVGNTKREIKRFETIQEICKKAKVELLVCENIDNSELVNHYNKADVCINFSDFEGGPQTFIEAALCEVPMLIKSNNELSKIIPCFTGETSEDFVKSLLYLKKNRNLCKKKGKEARRVALEKFTYKKTAEKFTEFFLNIDSFIYKKDLSKHLTVFVISCGDNPNYDDCIKSLSNQTVDFQLKFIKDISPMSAAFQRMIDDCKTDYYIQVDEDMILFENSIELIYNSLKESDKNICTVAHMLKDVHLDFNLYGIKGYKHNILKKYPYKLDIISCEVEQVRRLQNNGYNTLMKSKVIGYHSPKWTNEIIFERYFDLIEKWKNFKYDWLGELPSKLLQIFRNESSDINFYALMGALTSLSSPEKLRHREKNFEIKDENFEKIKEMSEKKEFKFIQNYDIEESSILTKNMFGQDKKTNNEK